MFVRGALFIIICLSILFSISLPLGGTVFITLIPLFSTGFGLIRIMRWVQKEIQKEKAVMNTIAEESFSNVRTVKAFQNEDAEIKRFKDGNEQVYQMGRRKALYTSSFNLLSTSLLYGSMAAIIYVASLLHKNE